MWTLPNVIEGGRGRQVDRDQIGRSKPEVEAERVEL